MNGLYGLKPWYARRLAGARAVLVARDVSPNTLTAGGVAFGAAAGLGLWLLRPGPLAALAVGALLVARLACTNLDGGVARDAGTATRFGAVAGEAGDRLAELAALVGVLALAPPWLVASTGLAATLPSWVALAGAAAGAARPQGGPVGKTERCLLLVLVAATGWAVPLLSVMAAGSLVTAAVRLLRIRRDLANLSGPVPATVPGRHRRPVRRTAPVPPSEPAGWPAVPRPRPVRRAARAWR
jgi:CDP-diacylglycerol--glycerol-3-phosphate 3-phosphatidyltransferase